MFEGFKKFILRGNVIDLAVGVVIGAAFNGIVDSLVKGLFNPMIGILGKPDFGSWAFTIGKSKFLIGSVINSLISFLLVALAVYLFVVIPMNKLNSRFKKPGNAEPDKKQCPECMSEIPYKANRCAYCTSKF